MATGFFDILREKILGRCAGPGVMARREIPVPEIFSEIDMDDLRYETLYLFFPECDKKVGVELWRRDLGGNCVTLVLDELLESVGKYAGFVYLAFWGETRGDSYASLGTIESMSSGLEYKGSFHSGNNDVMVLEIKPDRCKKRVSVPDDYMIGFAWGCQEDGSVGCGWREIPTSEFGGRFVLNFAVSGEFNMSILYGADSCSRPHTIFSKAFCCK